MNGEKTEINLDSDEGEKEERDARLPVEKRVRKVRT